MYVQAWAVELGISPYEPGPWSTNVWDTAYDNGQLDYFSSLSEKGRYSVLTGYLEFVLQNKSIKNNGSVLDVGCGAGLLYERCQHLDFKQWTGVDLSESAIAQAQDVLNNHADHRVNFIAENMLSPNTIWSDTTYDLSLIHI